jgi:UDP-3-O-[3-hydroxymyristoyl] glucosamine N-acyltransferase
VATTLSELAQQTGATLDGDGATAIVRVASLETAGPDALSFVVGRTHRDRLAATRAAAVIVPPELAADTALPKLVSREPYATYAKVATILHPPAPVAAGVHPTAVVGARARVAATATVGPRAVLGDDTIVGERARIGAGAVLGSGVSVGDDALIHANATIYDRCSIGPRTIVHSGAVIGADGFGMAEEGGRWLKIPQIGRVVIGADVEIGANTTIDRGALDDTVIDDDVKLDNQIQVGHNCRIGAHTAIAGCVGIAGSTRIGRNCRIGGAAMLNGHIDLCDGVIVTAGTGVMESIDRPGVYAAFWPAVSRNEWMRTLVTVRGVRDLAARVRRLERGAGGARGDAGGGPAGVEAGDEGSGGQP